MTAILEWLGLRGRGSAPKSFLTLANEPRPHGKLKTSALYIVQVDFSLTPDMYDRTQAMLDTLRDKYGLDFLILEPGFKLKRFDDY